MNTRKALDEFQALARRISAEFAPASGGGIPFRDHAFHAHAFVSFSGCVCRDRFSSSKLVQGVRRFLAPGILFNEKVAAELGLNGTDLQFLNLLELRGSATPGDLARFNHRRSDGGRGPFGKGRPGDRELQVIISFLKRTNGGGEAS